MRPIKITIKGINSYVSEQIIHFDKVAENKLFGIFGETGCGKTTILDCIVLALYGTSERESMQNVINVHSTDAYIIFEFEMFYDGENRHYRVERYHKVQKSGIKSTAILINTDDNMVLADKTEDVNEVIQKIIGVGKKEFLKCIAIPQGEFDAFLGDTPINRKKTIAKLFNLESFGVSLQEKLKNRKNLYNTKKITTEEKLAIYNNISEFNLNALELEKLDKERQKIDVEFRLNTEKTKNFLIVTDYENISKLNDSKVKLSEQLLRKEEIDYRRKQLEYTNAYGNYISVTDKLEVTTKDIKARKSDIIALRNNISEIEADISKEKKQKVELENTKKKLVTKETDYKSKQAEVSILTNSITKLENTINTLVDKSQEYDNDLLNTNNEIKAIKTAIQSIYLDLDDYNAIYKKYDAIIEKLNNASTLNLRKNISNRLNDIEKSLDMELIKTIESSKVASAIQNAVSLITSLREEQDFVIKDILSSLDIDFKGENLLGIKHDAEGKKDEVLQSINRCNNALQDANNKINLLNAKSTSIKLVKSNVVKDYKAKLVEFNKLKDKLSTLPSIKDIDDIHIEIEKVDHDIQLQEKNIAELSDMKSKIITDIKVKTAEIENLEKTTKELNEVLKMFDLNKMKDEIEKDKALLLRTIDEAERAKDEIAEYDNSYAYLTTLIKELNGKIHNPDITKDDIIRSEENISKIQEELNNIISELGAIQNNIKFQTDNLQIVKTLKEEYKDIIKQLTNIQKLQDLIANGALMEYIAEEYMYLITEFANNYVYSISKGKYLLKYDKDFFVLDNFNGGIARTIKTLSGGERFIVSLSLALGISQSIATNNNKSFNFFFIDEGFGSLSESYVDKILQSFDSLIKLNFTVGFITHVEKMKNYITNRIIVSKQNNDQGSIVKEEY
ncbi:MAG: SMC family ATPase [Clostridiales bacterium]|nr:SMC family ATPase [Clostridiales bacterium]